MSDAFVGALLGFAGLLIGVLGSEYFRRRSRIEGYSKEIFLKRLEVYEVLYEKLNDADDLASEFEKEDIGENDVQNLVALTHALVLDTAQFGDRNGLYINEEIFVQCMGTLMLIPSEGTPEELQTFRNEEAKSFRESSHATKQMIKEETGLGELERLFRGITRAKHDSEYLRYFRAKKREYKIK